MFRRYQLYITITAWSNVTITVLVDEEYLKKAIVTGTNWTYFVAFGRSRTQIWKEGTAARECYAVILKEVFWAGAYKCLQVPNRKLNRAYTRLAGGNKIVFGASQCFICRFIRHPVSPKRACFRECPLWERCSCATRNVHSAINLYIKRALP